MGVDREVSRVSPTVGVFSAGTSEVKGTEAVDFLFCFLDDRRDLSLDLSNASVDWNMVRARTRARASGGFGWMGRRAFYFTFGM